MALMLTPNMPKKKSAYEMYIESILTPKGPMGSQGVAFGQGDANMRKPQQIKPPEQAYGGPELPPLARGFGPSGRADLAPPGGKDLNAAPTGPIDSTMPVPRPKPPVPPLNTAGMNFDPARGGLIGPAAALNPNATAAPMAREAMMGKPSPMAVGGVEPGTWAGMKPGGMGGVEAGTWSGGAMPFGLSAPSLGPQGAMMGGQAISPGGASGNPLLNFFGLFG